MILWPFGVVDKYRLIMGALLLCLGFSCPPFRMRLHEAHRIGFAKSMAGVSHRGELIRDGCCTVPPAALPG